MDNTRSSGPVDVLAVGPVTVSAKELEWLLTSPAALRVLADYNDYNETMADACGADASFNRARREWFNAEAARIEAEWEAERTPEQRVFVHNAAMAELIEAGETLRQIQMHSAPWYEDGIRHEYARRVGLPITSARREIERFAADRFDAALANVGGAK